MRLVSGVRKYLSICRVSLIERLSYRGDFFLATLLRFLPMITTIVLWHAIYEGSGQQQLSGFTYEDMISYLLLVHISRMFSSMPGLSGGIARDIRDGNIKKYLLQPLDMLGYLLAYRVAHKISYIVSTALPYALLFFLCRGFFPGWPEPLTLAAYVGALLLSFLIGFFLECCLGMIGFWMLEVSSLLYIINTLNYFVSGHMFPLDLLAEPWATLFKSLPFQYLAYFPAAVFQGKIQGVGLFYGLLSALGWAVGLIALSRVLYRMGLRRYSAFGG